MNFNVHIWALLILSYIESPLVLTKIHVNYVLVSLYSTEETQSTAQWRKQDLNPAFPSTSFGGRQVTKSTMWGVEADRRERIPARPWLQMNVPCGHTGVSSETPSAGSGEVIHHHSPNWPDTGMWFGPLFRPQDMKEVTIPKSCFAE